MNIIINSKIDIIIHIILLTTIAVLAFLLIKDFKTSVLKSLIFSSVIIFIVSIYGNTKYKISDDLIDVVSGPFKWTINVCEITSIEKSKTLFSSPALSFDRILIKYNNRSIAISPNDKKTFIESINKVRRENNCDPLNI